MIIDKENKAVYILSLDAKDIFISNNYIDHKYNKTGYNIRFDNGNINTKKFINTFDYSLDLIKLQEVYEKVYRRTDLTFISGNNRKRYTQRVINVTFKYSNKEFNKVKSKKIDNKISEDLYLKFGHYLGDCVILDCVCIKNGTLVAIETNKLVKSPLDKNTLGKYFYFEDGVYKAKESIKSLNSISDLRYHLYENGFYCDGIKYIRFKRSSGSSRVGKCLFIDEKLYDRFHKWEMCNINIKEDQEIDLAAFESYISLPTSSIIDTLEINPDNILVMDDYESVFTDEVIAVTLEGEWLKSEEKEIEISNSIWDGQSLLDHTVFKNYSGYGMLLLRNLFFKSCCFNTNLQDWFNDHNITDVSQLNGYTLAKNISDIKLITTPNSIKYMKFSTKEQWLKQMDSTFGIVKHDKPTHFFDGRMVQVHYQLLNTLHLLERDVTQLVKPSLNYMKLIRSDPCVLRNHIKYPEDIEFELTSLNSKNDIIYNLLGINEKFSETKLYYDFVNDLLKAFKKNLRAGHLLVSGSYCTLIGNPIEMLLNTIGKFNGESQVGIGNIHTKKFEYNKILLGSRSPHVTMGNVWLPKNTENPDIDKYFNLSNEIVCVNSINENLLERLSGADFDSDTSLLTDNQILIDAAMKHYNDFKVPTNLVSARKIKRKYNNFEKAELDIKTSVNKIGEIINLAQELNTLIWDKINNGFGINDVMDIYYDVAKLDVMSNIEIDKAKKEYDVDNMAEIKKIKHKYRLEDENGKVVKPYFLGQIAKPKGYYNPQKKAYEKHKTTMDYLQGELNKFRNDNINRNFISFIEILDETQFNKNYVKYDQISRIITLIENMQKEIAQIFNSDCEDKYKIASEIRQDCVEYIDTIKMSYSTMYWLLYLINNDNSYKHLTRTIFNVLFGTPNKDFFECIKQSKTPLPVLKENANGTVQIYDITYEKIYKKT